MTWMVELIYTIKIFYTTSVAIVIVLGVNLALFQEYRVTN